ncbi:MAG: antibiotic biosynthesis monooxygenase [Myxococcota bacterium]
MIHVAITRTVRPGCEEQFEEQLHQFFRAAEDHPGTAGAYLIRPLAGSSSRQYGILRSFIDEAGRDAFYQSELYRRWNESVGDLVEGEPEKRPLHGLEAFFRAGGNTAPPAWKMALLTWIAVNPAVYIFANAVPAVFGEVPMLAELGLVNLGVVAILTWVFMPVLVRLVGPWLAHK